MRRREFLSSVLGGVAGGLPLAARADAPERMYAREAGEESAAMAAQCEQLSLRVQKLLWEVQVLNRVLVEEGRHRSQILGLVHAMRSPLAAIHIVTDIMRDEARDDVPDEHRRHLQVSARSSERLAELINKVFALERSRRQAAA